MMYAPGKVHIESSQCAHACDDYIINIPHADALTRYHVLDGSLGVDETHSC
jgi:hypothetical protein